MKAPLREAALNSPRRKALLDAWLLGRVSADGSSQAAGRMGEVLHYPERGL
jgi:hypothetical protein